MKENFSFTNPWYKKAWVIVLFVVLFLFLCGATYFAVQFVKIYRGLGDGNAAEVVTAQNLNEKAPYDMSALVDSMNPWTGNQDADIVIVEFGDFTCSQTVKEYPIIKQVLEKYSDKIKFIWRNYPLVHENSPAFARAGVCAQKQGKFWPLYDRLFLIQGTLAEEEIPNIALSAGLDLKKLNDCLANKLTDAEIRKDLYAAEAGGVSGTPTFFINGFRITGAANFKTWDDIIQKFLKIYEQNDKK